jgi:hypothetical protein
MLHMLFFWIILCFTQRWFLCFWSMIFCFKNVLSATHFIVCELTASDCFGQEWWSWFIGNDEYCCRSSGGEREGIPYTIMDVALMLLYLYVEYCVIIHAPLVSFLVVLTLTTFFAHLSFHWHILMYSDCICFSAKTIIWVVWKACWGD